MMGIIQIFRNFDFQSLGVFWLVLSYGVLEQLIFRIIMIVIRFIKLFMGKQFGNVDVLLSFVEINCFWQN